MTYLVNAKDPGKLTHTGSRNLPVTLNPMLYSVDSTPAAMATREFCPTCINIRIDPFESFDMSNVVEKFVNKAMQ